MSKANPPVLKCNPGRRHTPVAVKLEALERMKLGANVTELARELGVHRSMLYYWKLRPGTLSSSGGTEGVRTAPPDPQEREIQELQVQLVQTQSALGRKTMELDFFVGALRHIEPIAPCPADSSATGSTTTSPVVGSRKAE